VKRIRVIPVLLLKHGDLVKTTQFKDPVYIGDPINTVRIFNEKRVDELILLDISPNRSVEQGAAAPLAEIASEAFMPVAYGGGIISLQQVESILKLGVEKVVINSSAPENPGLITEVARRFGSQSIVLSIDVRRRFGRYLVFTNGGKKSTGINPVEHARRMTDAGAGEILITSIAHEGTSRGYDMRLVRAVAEAVTVPVIANGGASSVADFAAAVQSGHASAVAASSMFVYQGKHRAVLISFPDEALLRQELFSVHN
jgi:imidazole glycerol-phosphate synthase subunit HisF